MHKTGGFTARINQCEMKKQSGKSGHAQLPDRGIVVCLAVEKLAKWISLAFSVFYNYCIFCITWCFLVVT